MKSRSTLLAFLLGNFLNFRTEALLEVHIIYCSVSEFANLMNAGMKTITGSAVGGTRDTQEMINFCAAHNIYPKMEVIPIQFANEALKRLINSDVKYQFVIDIELPKG